ncbi:MAG: hypothetical protein JXB26_09335 [Candidatus Aminicenantes bacterium]|nr:hypothetical protein [Candidatus Aminicenantes bacterium]
MKLLKREQVEKLSRFKCENFLTTSFYLDTDKSRLTRKEISLSAKNLIRNHLNRLEKLGLDKNVKESLKKDLEKISRLCSPNRAPFTFSGLAVFSCSGKNFWEIFELPDAPRNRVIFDLNPYVRPLSAIIDEHINGLILLLDRKKAEWFEFFMGEVEKIEEITSDVPGKIKEGGWEGYESKRIERHIDAQLQNFFKQVAQKTFSFYKNKKNEGLFLGMSDKYYSDFEPLVHPYIKERIKGRLKSYPGDSKEKVIRQAQELEKLIKEKEESRLVDNFITELERGGLAGSGLDNILERLNRGQVQTLMVTRYFSKPGKICSKCGFLYVNKEECPACKVKTEPLVDVIDEAVERAMESNCQVKHINPPSKLRRYGNIGALLRY